MFSDFFVVRLRQMDLEALGKFSQDLIIKYCPFLRLLECHKRRPLRGNARGTVESEAPSCTPTP